MTDKNSTEGAAETQSVQTGTGKKDIFTYSAAVLTVVYILSLIPILLLGHYDYASADDYGFGAYAHIVWHNTGSVFGAIARAFTASYDRFMDWQGTYSSIVWMNLQPGIWNAEGYHLTVYIMTGLMTVSTLVFLYVAVVKVMNGRRSVWLGLSMLVLLMDVECMPDKTQGLYWFNGAAHYNIARCEALLFFAILMYRIWHRKERKCGDCVPVTVLTGLFAFWLGGANLITALITEMLLVCITAGLVIYRIRGGKGSQAAAVSAENGASSGAPEGSRPDISLSIVLVPLICMSVGFALNILAPGNSIRATEVEAPYGAVTSIALACVYCLKSFLTEWSSWEWLTFAALALPFAAHGAERFADRYGFRFRWPAAAVVISYLFLSAMFAPTLYGEGDTGAGRLHDIIFMDGTLWLIFDEFYLCGWFLDRKKKHAGNFRVYMLAAFAVTFLVAGLFTYLAADRFTTTAAVHMLSDGEARDYAVEAKRQIAELEAHEGDTSADVEFAELTVHPVLIFNEDFLHKTEAAENILASRYYQVNTVHSYVPEQESGTAESIKETE